MLNGFCFSCSILSFGLGWTGLGLGLAGLKAGLGYVKTAFERAVRVWLIVLELAEGWGLGTGLDWALTGSEPASAVLHRQLRGCLSPAPGWTGSA